MPIGIERANKLLDEAGFPRKADGIRFEMVHDITPYGEEWQRFGEAVQQALAQVGIKATLRYEDVATWLKRIYTDYDFDHDAPTSSTISPIPCSACTGRSTRDRIRPGTVFVNGARWSDPRADELMDKATVEPDPTKRGGLVRGAAEEGRPRRRPSSTCSS